MTVSTLTALCEDSQVGVVCVGGELRNQIMMVKWRQCVGCTARQMLILRCRAPSRGQSLQPSCLLRKISGLTHHSSCGQQRNHRCSLDSRTEVHWPESRSMDVDWEEVHRSHQEGRLLEVEHVKADRSMKEKQEMS